MSLRRFLRSLCVLAAVFHSAGNQAEHDQTVPVSVEVGEQAVLPCDVSAFMDDETSGEGLYILWVTGTGNIVCEFDKRQSFAHDGYRNRAEISRLEKHQYPLIINQTRPSDAGDYFCKLQKPGGSGKDVAGALLSVLGRVENRTLEEGEELSIPLFSLSSFYIEFRGESGNSTVCQVEKSPVNRSAEAYCQRLALRGGDLILSNLTAKDQGTYTVKEDGDAPPVMTLALKIIPHGEENMGRVENCTLEEGEELSIPLFSLSSFYIEFRGESGNSTVCQVENSQVTRSAEAFCQRLALRDGDLILSNLTAKDQGTYTVKGDGDAPPVMTLALKIIPHGKQHVGMDLLILILTGILAAVLLAAVLYYFIHEKCARRKVKNQEYKVCFTKEVKHFEENHPSKKLEGDLGETSPLNKSPVHTEER